MNEPHDKPSAAQVDLEMKLGFLEHTVDSLNQVILDQNQSIEELNRRIAKLEDRLGSLSSDDSEPTDPLSERPPHY
ncbi:MAG: SlyX protein [Planctomycetota bacterium]|jgi:SlyX protein